MEKKTVILATYGKTREHLHGRCIDSAQNDFGILVLSTHGNPHIDVARSLLACTALVHGADVAVFIDHDILFDACDVEALAVAARETQGVVGVPYSQRRMGGGFVGSVAPDITEVTFFEGGKLYEAPEALGMGFTAIHRSVFERLDAQPEYATCGSSDGPIRPYFQKLFVDNYWLPEDTSFCHAARKYGAKVYLDTRIRVKHLGDYPFGLEDCRVQIPDLPTMTVKVRSQ